MELVLDQSTLTAGSLLRGRVITSIADPENVQLVLEGKEMSFVVVVKDDQTVEFEESRVVFQMETPLTNGSEQDDNAHNKNVHPFEIRIPHHLPGSVMFQGRKGDKCFLEYSLQARHGTSTTVSVVEKIQLWAAPASAHATELVLRVGAKVPLVKSYFCGLWETPMDTYTLVPSLESLVLYPSQSFRVILKSDDERLEKKRNLSYPVHGKLTQQISWSAQGRTTSVNSTIHPITVESNNDPIRIPKMPPSYRGRLLRVHHEMILYMTDDRQQVVASTPVISVQMVEAIHGETTP